MQGGGVGGGGERGLIIVSCMAVIRNTKSGVGGQGALTVMHGRIIFIIDHASISRQSTGGGEGGGGGVLLSLGGGGGGLIC